MTVLDIPRVLSEPLSAEALEEIRVRSSPDFIPPCRLCGGALVQQPGFGPGTEYVCPAPKGVSVVDHLEHYRASKFTHRQSGNPDALLLLAEVDRLRELLGLELAS